MAKIGRARMLKPAAGGAKGTGAIESIRYSEDHSDAARVCIRYGPRPKKGKDGMTVGPWPETTEVVIPSKVAQALKIGQRVRVTVEAV